MQATHIVTLGDTRREVDSSTLNSAVEELMKINGGVYAGINVQAITDQAGAFRVPVGSANFPAPVDMVLANVSEPNAAQERVSTTIKDRAAAPVRGQTIDQAGAMRSLMDASLAEHAGFAPAKPLYARGTMVIDVGVENARSSRLEHDRKPLVEDACRDLFQTVRRENRRDYDVAAASLRLNANGVLVQPNGDSTYRFGPLSPDAFGSLLSRTGIEGHRYLNRCPSKLRATNVNNWLAGVDGLPVPGNTLKLRQRDHVAGGREVFAVVSNGYTPYDADEVARDVIEAFTDSGARGTVHYDGSRTRIEAIYHSNIQPEDYVAGEFFKAGVIIRTDDTGAGSLKVSACVWQNLCLNLIIIDQAEQEVAALRHIGDKMRMADRFTAALAEAQEKVSAFTKQWGYACHESLAAPKGEVLAIDDVVAGYSNGIIERDLVPVRGKRQEVVKQLVSMHAKDTSGARLAAPVTRASLINAFTRWAHEVNQDPFLADDISRAAGKLVGSDRSLPFVTLDVKG